LDGKPLRRTAGLSRRTLIIARAVGLWICALMLAMPQCAAPARAESAAPEVSAEDLADFKTYVTTVWPKAEAKGVSRAMFTRAFANLAPDMRILAKPKQQPEHVQPIWDYLSAIVSEKRFALGQKAYAGNLAGMKVIEQAYGVPPQVIVAVWGVESMYGTNMGQYGVIRSLATLGWRGGRRARFGEQQLISALRILEHGDVAPERMTGSWAGAMGHTQFIPTTYEAYAVDFDRDGRRDIWGSATDAVASAANLLKSNGWKAGEPWGFEVQLPARFDLSQAGLSNRKPLSAWAHAGVRRASGKALEPTDMKAALLLPAGANGPALLVTGNFRALLRYNNSISYGLAVAWLAQKLIDGPFIEKPWPVSERSLLLEERKELQRLLAARGLVVSSQDGLLGPETVKALKSYQQSKGLPADGFPSLKVLEALRKDEHS
jgi:membrane-bound lytic murein transglycosylase B